MTWLQDIRNKPHHYKVRLIWTVTGVTLILLIALWIVSAKFAKHVPADKTFFQTIGRGFKDVNENYKDIPKFIQSQQEQQQ